METTTKYQKPATDIATVVPALLREQKRWTAWEERPQRGKKPAKVPLARTNDNKTWLDFGASLKAAAGHAGVGFMMTGATGLVGIDIDGCVDPSTGAVTELAQSLLRAIPDTYAEVTPSGKGLRLFATIPEGSEPPPEFLSREHGVECYVGKSARYLTVTGRALPGRAGRMADITTGAVALLAKYGSRNDAEKPPPGADGGAANAEALPIPAFTPMDPARHAFLTGIAAQTEDHRALIEEGLPSGGPDRSKMVFAITRELLKHGCSREEVFQFLRSSRGAWSYALSHRGFIEKRALNFLWKESDPNKKNATVAAELPAATAAAAPDSAGFVLDPEAEVRKLNERFFIAPEGGKVRVFERRFDVVLRRHVLERYQYEDFARLWSHVWWWEGQGRSKKKVQLGRYWIDSPHARRYSGIVFDPSGREYPPDVLNLWTGFAIEPKAGNWSVVREHIRDVICSGDESLTAYVLGWLARFVQRPGEPGEVALVLRGREGTGKGLFAKLLLRVFGQHGLQVSQPGHVVGHFNAHLKDCLALFADEAFFAGDRAHASVLKALVTEEWLMIEPKGIDPYPAANRLHVIMATNNRWAVPAGLDARRFAVIDVSDSRLNDRGYFKRLALAVNDDAVIGAMLWDLLHHDLSTYEVRDLPKTAALDDQKAMSLDGVLAWLRDVLAAGTLDVAEAYAAGWDEFSTTTAMHAAFERWGRRNRFDRPVAGNIIARDLKRIFGESVRASSEYAKTKSLDSRARGFWLGTLAEARAKFCAATGLGASIFDSAANDDDADDARSPTTSTDPAPSVAPTEPSLYDMLA
jgi:hypothetical protein